MKSGLRVSLILLALSTCGSAYATEMVYVPLNPTFGGNPLNGPNLLNTAQATNWHTDPNAPDFNALGAPTQQTPLQQFNDTLQRSILSRVAASASSSIIGTNGTLQPGTVQTGDFIISVVAVGGGMLQITTTDKTTGAQTSFQVGQ
ncbi:MAG: curli assembly protein CsgF [Candidimonas sp.]|nr:MAG: curli assembly protein CsgF [Candidimonas sp.]TAM22766.1 MAG: curli assembly protein CsgF [Candidimonas sp.]TAM74530.1 MAG: curli assembly protein CsgF [Candidimonas sp.]